MLTVTTIKQNQTHNVHCTTHLLRRAARLHRFAARSCKGTLSHMRAAIEKQESNRVSTVDPIGKEVSIPVLGAIVEIRSGSLMQPNHRMLSASRGMEKFRTPLWSAYVDKIACARESALLVTVQGCVRVHSHSTGSMCRHMRHMESAAAKV